MPACLLFRFLYSTENDSVEYSNRVNLCVRKVSLSIDLRVGCLDKYFLSEGEFLFIFIERNINLMNYYYLGYSLQFYGKSVIFAQIVRN